MAKKLLPACHISAGGAARAWFFLV